MSKQYALEVENIGEDTYILITRGHHGFADFMAAVRQGYDWPLGMPQHIWMKTMPARDQFSTEWYEPVREGARGAWPCTYVAEAYGDERYEVLVAKQFTGNAEAS